MIRRLDCTKHKPRQLKSNKEGRNFLSSYSTACRNSPNVIPTSVEIPQKTEAKLVLGESACLRGFPLLLSHTVLSSFTPSFLSSSFSLLSVNSRDARGERGGGRRMTNESLAGFGGELYHGRREKKRWRRRRRKWALKSRLSFPRKKETEKKEFGEFDLACTVLFGRHSGRKKGPVKKAFVIVSSSISQIATLNPFLFFPPFRWWSVCCLVFHWLLV